MTRETKVGLLIGMAVILLIGIILTDHLSLARTRQMPNMTDFANDAQHGLRPPTVIETDETSNRRVHAPARSWHSPGNAERRHQAVIGDPLAARNILEVETPDVRDSEPQDANPRHESTATFERPEPDSVAIVHVVRRGESLWDLANRYYDHGRYWQWIRDANPRAVAADNTIQAGTKLKIPELPSPVEGAPDALNDHATSVPGDARADHARAADRTIRVVAGDSFGGLAQRHLGSSAAWRNLFDANRKHLELDQPRDLRPGMVLHLSQNTHVDVRGTQPEPTEEQTYVVAHGDSLSTLAARFLGDAKKWRRIYDANRNRLADPNTLPLGQEIVLP